jgi:hypothetical protein
MSSRFVAVMLPNQAQDEKPNRVPVPHTASCGLTQHNDINAAAVGPVVDEDALIAALSDENHGPAAAALDVVSQEPLPTGHPLTSLPNVVLTPHIGGFSERMFREFWRLSAESVVAMASGMLPESFVNPDAVAGSGFTPAAGTGGGAAAGGPRL